MGGKLKARAWSRESCNGRGVDERGHGVADFRWNGTARRGQQAAPWVAALLGRWRPGAQVRFGDWRFRERNCRGVGMLGGAGARACTVTPTVPLRLYRSFLGEESSGAFGSLAGSCLT